MRRILPVALAAILATALWFAQPGDDPGTPPAPASESRRPDAPVGAPQDREENPQPGPEAGPVRLRGKIVHGDGSPFRGFCSVASEGEHPVAVAEDGGFVLRGAGGYQLRIAATAEGFRAVSGLVSVPREEEFLFVVSGKGRAVTGRVFAAGTGEPIAGATVGTSVDGGRVELTGSTTTDAEGRFRCPFRAENGLLAATAPGYAPAEVRVRHGAEVDVPMLRGGIVEGTVVTAKDGTPLPGISVHAFPGDSWDDDDIRSVETDRAGAFRIEDLPAGDWTLFALGSDWCPKDAGALKETSGYNPFALHLEAGETVRRELEVVPAGRVVGRVLDADGSPVPGASVWVARSWRTWDGFGERLPETTAGPDGAFRLGALFPGVFYAVRARTPDHSPVGRWATAAVGSQEEVELRFDPPGYIDVHVTDPGGRPVAGATLILGPPGSSFEIVGVGWTGPDGRVRVGSLPQHMVEMSVYATGYFSRRLDGAETLQPGVAGEVPTVSVVLRPGLGIRGRVVLPEGALARKIEVSATSVEDEDREVRADVDVDGEFRISPLEPGSHRLHATAVVDRRGHEASVDVEAGRDGIVLRLAPSGPAPSEPIPPWIARVVGEDGTEVASGGYAMWYVDEDGRGVNRHDRFTNGEAQLPRNTGSVTVEVFDLRDRSGGVVPLGPLRAGPFPRADGDVVLRLPPEKVIAGRIVRPDGGGVRAVRVEARPAERRGVDAYWPPFAREVADGDGRFTLRGLAEEEYVLRFHSPPGFAPLPSIRATAGGDPLVIRLAPSKRAVVTVEDTDGDEVGEARIVLRRREIAPGGSRWVDRDAVTADEAGRAVIDDLSADAHYRLDVYGDSSEHREKKIEPWDPVDSKVVLLRKRDLVGFVLDPSGAPIHDVRVMRRTDDGWDSETTDAEGRFVFDDLDDLRAELVVAARYLGEEERKGLRGMEVNGAGGPVHLTFDPGPFIAVRLGPGWRGMPQVLLMTRDEPGIRSSLLWSESDRALFAGLETDARYDLWVGPHGYGGEDGDDQFALLENVAPSKEDLVVRPKEGKSIRGRLEIGGRRARGMIRVALGGGPVRLTRFSRDGKFAFRGLPEGKYTIAAADTIEGVSYEGTATVEAGAEVEIDLRPE